MFLKHLIWLLTVFCQNQKYTVLTVSLSAFVLLLPLPELTEPEAVDDGILYADSPGEKVAMERTRRERRRRKIIKELFETEKAYLNHLELIHKVRWIDLWMWVLRMSGLYQIMTCVCFLHQYHCEMFINLCIFQHQTHVIIRCSSVSHLCILR